MSNEQVTQKVLNEKDAAKFLGLSAKTLQSWRWKGSGPDYLKFGDGRCAAVRYEIAALEDFKKRSRVTS
ncbi:helix-turn-helix transcriptional regulator [Desulfonatronum parangueonense]